MLNIKSETFSLRCEAFPTLEGGCGVFFESGTIKERRWCNTGKHIVNVVTCYKTHSATAFASVFISET